MENRREEIKRVLSVNLRKIFDKMAVNIENLQEIRLRINGPLLIVYQGKEFFVSKNGELTHGVKQAYRITQEELKQTMEFISNYSLYAFEEELRQGFVTIQGGHRVGVAGKIILEKDRIKNMKHISYINIRLAHEVLGCANKIFPYIIQGDSIYHTLIVSPPRCGKTTLLRDLIRQLSNGWGNQKGITVGVVDERSELGACYLGRPQNDLGCRTDVLDCCPKQEGMMMMVRSMSPTVIAVDEIGSKEDVAAMEYVMNCGVKLLATVHGSSMEEIRNKPVLGNMVRERMFERYVVLKPHTVGKVQAVFDGRGTCLGTGEDFII